MDGQDYRLYKTYENPGITVRVYRPDLTPAEHDKRMDSVKKAAEALVKEQRGRK